MVSVAGIFGDVAWLAWTSALTFGVNGTYRLTHLSTQVVTDKCGECGREVEWRDELKVGTMEIECIGSTVICICGYGVEDDGGTIREFRVPDAVHTEI